ncbi:MAG TPA: hypothetical protein VFY58_11470 [Nocardioides sp.]|nr:hypothetical protein [Nocardioides sp.]
MNGPLRIVGFLAVLAVVFAGALAVGNAAGPVSEPVADDPADHSAEHAAEDDAHAGHVPAAGEEVPGGLMVSQDGYTLRLLTMSAEPGRDVPIRFTIEGPDGGPVTAYDVEHGKQLHLIAVRRDVTGFQHVHPTLRENGVWVSRLDLTAGDWRVFTDFNPTGGVGLTLGADLTVPGLYRPEALPGPARTAQVDGYTVRLAGALTPGEDSTLTLTVSRGGRPVTDLQPYLGAYGHLVALREGDLAYLHVHPEGAPGDGTTESGPDVEFEAAVPSAGRYRLFLDFRHDGSVHTAEFALAAAGAGGGEGGSHGHSH